MPEFDEAMVEAGDRDYKNFEKSKLEMFVMHRHYNMDIVPEVIV